MASTRTRCILPLPEQVVAQIKSSTAIVSLSAVVLELLKNSLDAKASSIEATVDFARGACVVQDNGLGIAPSEFSQDGCLAKLYCTSKYASEDACLGRNGTFLASLSAMCLLQIVSRHHQNRSTNLLSFHHSKVIDRQLPAQPQHDIHENHGTRVTIRNLFGNLPVRVKQRAALTEQKSEIHRLWEMLKYEVTSLLLSWKQPVALRIRNPHGHTLLKFSNSAQPATSDKNHSSALYYMLNTLTQADYIAFDEWSSWIPTSASTSTMSIRGAISLHPAPTKRVQFISLGTRPLSADSGHNVLFDEVNRVFSLSSFGIVDNDANLDDRDKIRRRNHGRSTSDGYTNRQLTARKGVDRFPMFHLRISLKNTNTRDRSEDQSLDDEANLQAVIDVLNAMVTQWLSAHHFQPRQPTTKRTFDAGTLSDSDPSIRVNESVEQSGSRSATSQTRKTSDPRANKRRKSKSATHEQAVPAQPGLFAQWSRIKSGKADFFDNLNPATKLKTEEPTRPLSGHARFDLSSNNSQSTSNSLYKIHAPPLAEALNANIENEPPDQHAIPDGGDDGENMIWTDPTSKQRHLLDARTGCVVTRPPSGYSTASSGTIQAPTLSQLNKPICLPQGLTTSKSAKVLTPWLSNVLETWDNPVFGPTEKRIQQVLSYDHVFSNHDHSHGSQSGTFCAHTDNFAGMAVATNVGKLSKQSLAGAEVMAQIDCKFILVKIWNFPHASKVSDSAVASEVLVLIDQHAADERIQVETLFSDLCQPLPKDHVHSRYRSKLGHRSQVAFNFLDKPIQFTLSVQEEKLFTTNADRFSAWGILYNIATSNSISARPQSILSVITLPPAISERCKADPQILISCLRTAVWTYADAPYSSLSKTSEFDELESESWVTRLSTCPHPLIDLINSRACRSAIMFNDELGLSQCKELVAKLAQCVFPFMCAHGRPSLVPLVDLGAVGEIDGNGLVIFGAAEVTEKTNFVDKWRAWKR